MNSATFVHRWPVLCPLVLLLAAGACTNPLLDTVVKTNIASPGTLEVSLSTSGEDRSVIPSDYLDTVEGYEILITGTQSMGPLLVVNPVLVLEDMPLGEYTVSATAYGPRGRTLAAGSLSAISVKSDVPARAEVVLLPVMGGEGTIRFSADWNGAGYPDGFVDRAFTYLTPAGGESRSVDVQLLETGLVFSGDFPSGEYTLESELYRGDTLVSLLSVTLRVFEGMETEAEVILNNGDFSSPPPAPDTPESLQTGLSVTLNWVDTSDLETGYAVYRSNGGGEYSLIGSGLPANSTAWTDEPVEPGSDYTYRIVALNAFGESQPRDIDVSVEPPLRSPDRFEPRSIGVLPGDEGNHVPLEALLEGYENTLNNSPLEVVQAELEGGGSVKIDNGVLVVDTSSFSPELEGLPVLLNYTVHIAGQPRNSTWSAPGSVYLIFDLPEIVPADPIDEESPAEPVPAYIYDDREAMERRMALVNPQLPQEIIDSWYRVVDDQYFKGTQDDSKVRRDQRTGADMALQWKLKEDREGPYIEFARNSVYAAVVNPDGLETDRFTLEATVSSKDDDDDTAGLVVAFVREGDTNYILEAARSRGAVVGTDSVEPRNGWGLVLRRLTSGQTQQDMGTVLWSIQPVIEDPVSGGWNNARTRIRVIRRGDTVTVAASAWNETERFEPLSEISVELGSDPRLRRFSGPKKFGFFTASQERTSFRDIILNGE